MEKLQKLTKEEALQYVEKIKESTFDDEKAHGFEDNLYYWFIHCVADGMYEKDEAVEIANIVKSTDEIEFSRWCA